MDKALIHVNTDTQTVSARELHSKLNIATEFRKWFPRMAEYGFSENEDFNPVNFDRVQKEGSREVKREVTDYQITLDMAKHICMIQRTPEGKQVRQYLLDLEKAWNTPEQVFARALKMADKTIHSLEDRCHFLGEQVTEQQKVIETLQPKASYYDVVLQSEGLIPATTIAKDYGMSARKFNTMLHQMGVQFKQGNIWVLYAKYQAEGYIKTRTHTHLDADGVSHTAEHSYWTQKGRLFLYDFLRQQGIFPLIEQGREEHTYVPSR